MHSNPFPSHGLYAITNGPRHDMLDVVLAALSGGARMLQYRDKTGDSERRHDEACQLLALCQAFLVPLIINDDIELAERVGADGVHLGEQDGDVARARAQLGPQAIVGVSCYDALANAQRAVSEGASYIAFGAFFASPTKPQARRAHLDLLRQSAALGVPRVAIGGITPDNAGALVDAGADYVAVISALFDAPDVDAAARRFSQLYSSTLDEHLHES